MPLDEDLSDYFAGFSIIFSYLYDPDGLFQMNVSKVSTAQFIPGRARPDEGGNLHASETFLKPLERLAIFEAGRGAAIEDADAHRAGRTEDCDSSEYGNRAALLAGGKVA